MYTFSIKLKAGYSVEFICTMELQCMYIAMLVYSILSLSMYVYTQWINSTKIYLQECPFYVHVSVYVSYESLRVMYYCIPEKKEQLTTVSAQYTFSYSYSCEL